MPAKNKPGISAFAKAGEKRRQRERVVTCAPAATAALESLFKAAGVKVVTVKGSKHQQKRRSAGKAIRPATDDPSAMLGPLVPDDPEDDEDDTPGGM
jgi:hypothetical protein